MTDNNENLKLIRMNEVEAEEIRWLWYPYIPLAKLRSFKVTLATQNNGGAGHRRCADNRETISRGKPRPAPRATSCGSCRRS